MCLQREWDRQRHRLTLIVINWCLPYSRLLNPRQICTFADFSMFSAFLFFLSSSNQLYSRLNWRLLIFNLKCVCVNCSSIFSLCKLSVCVQRERLLFTLFVFRLRKQESATEKSASLDTAFNFLNLKHQWGKQWKARLGFAAENVVLLGI